MGFLLRIFDGEQQKVRVEEIHLDSIKIGRGDTCDVHLASPYVSREHALIRRVEGRFFIESVGKNLTYINRKEIPLEQSVAVLPDTEIRIAEFSLFIEAPRVDADDGEIDVARSLAEIELDLHAKLLERVDLRDLQRQSKAEGGNLRLRRALEELVNTRVPENAPPDMPEEVVQHALRESIYGEVIQEVLVRTAATDEETSIAGYMAKLQSMLSKVVNGFCKRLGVEGTADSVRSDLRKVDEGFQDVFKEFHHGASPQLRTLLVRRFLTREIMNLVLGFGPLQDLLELPNTSEIMVVHKDLIYIERDGNLERLHRTFITDEILLSIIQRIVEPLGRRIDRSTPLVDARLPDGSRVNAIIPPLAIKGPCLTIRRFSKNPLQVADLIRFGSLTPSSAEFLRACVRSHKNMVISGGTGSGKTSLLNILSGFVADDERIVTMEDSAELQLRQTHVVTLETRPPNVEGKGEYTIRDLVKNSLRMRPDRVIVGECRGGEALDMLQAMNTGHDGSLTTVHANTPQDALLRLETMVMQAADLPVHAIRSQIEAAIHIIVQTQRLPSGKRMVTHISEVVGLDPETGVVITNDIFEERNEHLVFSGYLPSFMDQVVEKGYLDPQALFEQSDEAQATPESLKETIELQAKDLEVAS